MSITITSSSISSCISCSFNNERISCCNKLVHGSIKLFKKIDQPPLYFKFNTNYQIPRVVPMPGSLQTRASSSSSSSSSSSPTPSSSSPWKKWLMGILLTLILPAAGHKGGLFVALKGKIDQAVETVEHVTEVVEEIAEQAEKIVAEVEEKLPGDSKIKEALQTFDDLAKMAINESKKAEDIIHKVKDVEEEIEGALLKVGKDHDKK